MVFPDAFFRVDTAVSPPRTFVHHPSFRLTRRVQPDRQVTCRGWLRSAPARDRRQAPPGLGLRRRQAARGRRGSLSPHSLAGAARRAGGPRRWAPRAEIFSARQRAKKILRPSGLGPPAGRRTDGVWTPLFRRTGRRVRHVCFARTDGKPFSRRTCMALLTFVKRCRGRRPAAFLPFAI